VLVISCAAGGWLMPGKGARMPDFVVCMGSLTGMVNQAWAVFTNVAQADWLNYSRVA